MQVLASSHCAAAPCARHAPSRSVKAPASRAVAAALAAPTTRPSRRAAAVRCAAQSTDNGASDSPREFDAGEYLAERTSTVAQHFPNALTADNFIARLEVALYAFGFTGENSIAISNLCRDEVTIALKQRIDSVFGSSFDTNGLGGVLTAGVIGMKAALSHSPQCATTSKERYVFFSFPHIAINSEGTVGALNRPLRPGQSCACGAMAGALAEFKKSGIACNCSAPGLHDVMDPEFSILKQRLARRLRYEGMKEEDVDKLDMVSLTKAAERTITDDLEGLIKQAVDLNKADYAVVTGVQIHNWAAQAGEGEPNLEYVAPAQVYAVVNGERTYLDLAAIPAMAPRQLRVLAGAVREPELVPNMSTWTKGVPPPAGPNARAAPPVLTGAKLGQPALNGGKMASAVKK